MLTTTRDRGRAARGVGTYRPGLRSALLVIGIAVVTAGAWQAIAAGGSRPAEGVRLDADAAGTVTEWLLALSPRSHRLFVRAQADLVERAHPAIRFRIVYAQESARRSLGALLRARGVTDPARVRWVKSRAGSDPWTCDYFLMGHAPDGGSVAFLHAADHYARAWGPGRASDPDVYVRALSNVQPIRTPFRGEGGMVVADEERAFVSATALQTALAQGDAGTEAHARAALESALGLPISWIRSPDEGRHIDVCMMPVGNRRVVIGSARLTRRLLEKTPRSAWKTFDSEVHEGATASGLTVPADASTYLVAQSRNRARGLAFDRLRDELTKLGYACTEVPFLAIGDQHDPMRIVVSYTNVIQDVRDGVRTVYLPTYGVAPLDEHAAAAWKHLGYRVVPIRALGAAIHGGSVRCLSQVRKVR